MSDEQVIATSGSQAPVVLMRMLRLHLFIRVCEKAPKEMLDWVAITVGISTSWLHCIVKTLQWLSHTCPAFHECRQWHISQWVCCARDGPKMLKHAIYKAMTSDECQNTAAWATTRAQAAMAQDWPCPFCHKVFRSRQAFATHAYNLHQQKAPARRYVDGTHCAARLAEFRTRARVVSHLSYRAPACMGSLVAAFEPLSDAMAEALDDADKERNRRLEAVGRTSRFAEEKCFI